MQLDTCKIAPGCYQYTAVDDCTRYRVLAVFPRHIAVSTLVFFLGARHQRPNQPASPHLNGNVEHSQKTDREEFWAVSDPRTSDVELRLAEWQHYYNWDRPHGSLNGHTPIEAVCAKQEATPIWDEVEAKYDPTGERFQVAHYQTDFALRRQTEARLQAQAK